MRTWTILALLALFVCAFAFATEVDLPPANFASPVTKVFTSSEQMQSALKGHRALVCFFNARCPHCKSFVTDFINAARKSHSDGPKDVGFYAMDAELNPHIPPGFVFSHFPGIFYVDASGNKIPYTDSRDSFTIHNFVKQAAAGKPSLLETSVEDTINHYKSLMTVQAQAENVPAECRRQEPFSMIESEAESEADAEVDAEADAEAEEEGEADEEAEEEGEADAEAETESEQEQEQKTEVDAEAEASLLEVEAETEVDAEAEAEVDAEAELEAELDAEVEMEEEGDADADADADADVEAEAETEEDA